METNNDSTFYDFVYDTLTTEMPPESHHIVGGCSDRWAEHFQKPVYHAANIILFLALLAPNTRRGLLIFHLFLVIVFLLYSTWAWNVCAPDVFPWHFSFMVINMAQALYIVYRMRPVRFSKDLEEVYQTLFQPIQVPRLDFKKLVDFEYAQVITMQKGETYAMQNMTRCDRLALLISGTVNVVEKPKSVLHTITGKQFMDSPEFESCSLGSDEKYQVSIVAAETCRYILWQRQGLEYLFTKEPYLANVMSFLIARDIANKLYALNNKIVNENGAVVDIRLPPVSPALSGVASLRHKIANDVVESPQRSCLQTRSDDSEAEEVLIVEEGGSTGEPILRLDMRNEAAHLHRCPARGQSPDSTITESSNDFGVTDLLKGRSP